MTGRHGPPLFSLNYNVALAAVNFMRRGEADPHHGQARDRSAHRPDRLLHPQPTLTTFDLQREATQEGALARSGHLVAGSHALNPA